MPDILLRILETQAELTEVELLQRIIWPDSDLEVVPSHLLLASIHNGGLLIGAFEPAAKGEAPASVAPGPDESTLVGFVFSFPGVYHTPDGPRLKHHSHMLGVLPSHRDRRIGFMLKRAQWQMVRHQGLDRITWTYDPLLSRNAHLNITHLGAVCSTYFPNYYGEMRDGINLGTPSDRFQVDWWVNSRRVTRRLGKQPRQALDLAHYLAAGTPILNPSGVGPNDLPLPNKAQTEQVLASLRPDENPLVLLEIPSDFQALKARDPDLALAWRLHTRAFFTGLFEAGYLVTDFVYLKGTHSRSFYVLCYGESTL